MHKKNLDFIASIGLVFIAIWWLWFITWQIGFVNLVQNLSFEAEPPSLSVNIVTLATSRALEYATKGGPLIADIFFTRDEISHLIDVSVIYKTMRVVLGLLAFSGFITLIIELKLRKSLPSGVFLVARNIVIILTICLGAALLLFPVFFLLFHEVIFPKGNWAFPVQSTLIQIFPETFWKLITGWFLIGGMLFSLLYHMASHELNDQ